MNELPPRRLAQPLLLSDGSVLRKATHLLDARQRLIIDGVRISFDMAGLAFYRLETVLEQLSTMPGEAADNALFIQAISDAWLLVDTTHRLRKLAPLLPDAKGTASVKYFLDRTTCVHSLRNDVQHLDERFDPDPSRNLQGLVAQGETTWGSLSWILIEADSNPLACCVHLIVSGTAGSHRPWELPNPGAQTYRSLLDRIALHAHGKQTSLTEVFEATADFAASVEQALTRSLSSLPGAGVQQLHMRLSFVRDGVAETLES